MTFAAATTACIFAALPFATGLADDDSSPIFGVKIPEGYRHWELIAPPHEEGSFNELRGILGNAVAVKAYRDGTLTFPDGAIFSKLAWKRAQSLEFRSACSGTHNDGPNHSKDSKKYGWWFGRFIDGKAVDKVQHETCFACHEANVKAHGVRRASIDTAPHRQHRRSADQGERAKIPLAARPPAGQSSIFE